MRIDVPVTKPARALHRNVTTSANSSGVPTRPTGIAATCSARMSSTGRPSRAARADSKRSSAPVANWPVITTLTVAAGASSRAALGAVLAVGLGFYLPDLVVWFLARRRKEGIFLGLPDALDLMVVCVEAGLGLDQAMRKVSEEMKRAHPVIAEEFSLANFQLQMGRPKAEVWHEMGVRSGVGDVRALATVVIQADKFGSSVAQALRVQSDSMRTRRRQLAEEKAAKTAVKLIFPLVMFIFPGIFVVLVGPAAITMVRELFPMMSAGH